jgi:RND family efflux transporter MFP subunit
MSPKTKRIGLIIVILVGAVAVAALLGQMKPPPGKKEASVVELVIDTLPLSSASVAFTVQSQGTVTPRTETLLSAEVAGSIVGISPKFVAGGVFAKGEELLRIDPTNYQYAVAQAQALLDQRVIEYNGANKLKQQGYRAESELASAATAMALAEAELVRAKRNLERTSIKLPYDGLVRSKDVDLGQYVNPGSRLGVTFATDYAEVRLALADSDLGFLKLPAVADLAAYGEMEGPRVTLTATQRGVPTTWEARIVRTEGVVDEKSRATYVVARIKDPYQLQSSSKGSEPLPMGTFVHAAIEGTVVDDLIRIPRSAIRGNGQVVFVDDEDRLRIRPVTVLRSDATYAYLSGGAAVGDRISVTAIESPINGLKVNTTDSDPGDTPEPPESD